MIISFVIFFIAVTGLLTAANFFTQSAEKIGYWLKLPPFVIGIFIIGIGTSLPELVSGILAVIQGNSEILPGNVVGASISNLLLVTGFAIVLNRKEVILNSKQINIDLHFLVGAAFLFLIVSYDGVIDFTEGFFALLLYVFYSFYLLKGEKEVSDAPEINTPWTHFLILIVAGVGIYFGANYTISSLTDISVILGIPSEIIALTVLSIGTTLPEIAVNVQAVRKGKVEMAVGSILGSCVFNITVIPAVSSFFGDITVPTTLLSFSIPVFVGAVLFFYLLIKDKKMSLYEGMLFILIYFLFIFKTITG